MAAGRGNVIKKSLNYLKNNGVNGILSQVRYKMAGPGLSYNSWLKENHEDDEETLAAQRETHFDYEPVISIIVPVYMTPEFYLRSMIESVKAQTYSKWQLCIVDGSQVDRVDREGKSVVSAYEKIYSLDTEKVIRQYMAEDSRITYRLLDKNRGISENANIAITMSEGEYIGLLAHDDILSEGALYSVVNALNKHKYKLLYSDEDKMSEDGSKYSNPAFKPDFSLDLIRSYNYISRFLVVEKNLAIEAGGFRREFDGAWDYDFILRCCEKTGDIFHIPRILYHRRMTGSAAENTAKRELANEVGKRALASHIGRCSIYATVMLTDEYGINHIVYETPGNPFISIVIIGNKSVTLMSKCLKPLFEFARYSNFEIIIVDYDGENEEMLKFYQRIQKQRKNINVVCDKESKTIGALKNFGASHAKGEYILFLGSNTELMEPASIGEMIGICMREEVGVVGGTLYNENETINSAELVVGLNGAADYIYRGTRKGQPGYMMNNLANRNCSAVSSSCMLIKRKLFEELRGFSRDYISFLSDVDLCLKVREANKLIVCAAKAAWYVHHDAVDAAAEISHISKEQFEGRIRGEENIFRNLWSHIIENGDPYYNINFTREGNPFTLSNPVL